MSLPSEYEAYLKANLNAFERMSQTFSAIDERVDYTNILLTRLLELQGGSPTTPTWVAELLTGLDDLRTTLDRLANAGFSPVVPNRENFIHGEKNVTTAGTAEQL